MSENVQVLKKSISSDILIFTFCNFGYILFIKNYIKRLDELKTKWKLFIICIDKKSFDYLTNDLKYSFCIFIDFKLTSNFTYWNQNQDWNKIQFTKLDCFQYILDIVMNNTEIVIKKIIYTDTDIYVYKDFFNNVSKNYNEKNIYYQNDNENPLNLNNDLLCAGFMIFNCDSKSINLDIFKYKKYIGSNFNKFRNGDQDYLNIIRSKYTFDTIPRSMYPNGVFFNHNCIHQNAHFLHYNWMIGHEKIKNMMYNCHIELDDLHKKTDIIYPPFSKSSTIEEYFYNYVRNRVVNSKTKYLSLFWTNILNHNVNCIETIKKYKLIEPNNNLYTITQHDDGFRNYAQIIEPNMLFFSAGKFYKHKNNIDIPLIYDDNNYFENIGNERKNEEIKYLCSFVGAKTHPIRIKMHEIFKNDSNMYFSVKSWNNKIDKNSQDEFINITLKSKFGLAPRGYGCTSFRLYEILKLGRVPVYICNDEFKLPYKEIFDFSEICVLIHEKEISSLKEKLLNISDEQYKQMLENYQKYKHLFTMDGMCEYILNKVK